MQPEQRFEPAEGSVNGKLGLIVHLKAVFLQRVTNADLDFVGLGSEPKISFETKTY